jgi:hypothetical protein
MQVIVCEQQAGGARRGAGIGTLVAGTLLVLGAGILAFEVYGTGFLSAFTPTGRATTTQLVIGALAWSFALVAPASFGMLGIVRVGRGVEHFTATRPRTSPAMRVRSGIPDDHAVATRVRLPDGSRIVPELVIGPFGAAVIEELPPIGAVVARGPRSWEVRFADGRVHMIDQPFERATRDAERVRAWFSDEASDHVVKVYAAVVGTDPNATRTSTCAYITAEQVGAWLASLPPQRSFDAGRRDRVIRQVRAGL